MKSKKMTREKRREHILNAAVMAAEAIGYNNVSYGDTADRAGVVRSLVYFHFHTVAELQDAILSKAIASKNLKIIAQAAVNPQQVGGVIPEDLRRRALGLAIEGDSCG